MKELFHIHASQLDTKNKPLKVEVSFTERVAQGNSTTTVHYTFSSWKAFFNLMADWEKHVD